MEEVLQAVLSILKAARDAAPSDAPLSKVRRFFVGDPVLVAASDLPAVVVMPVSENVTARGTAYDQSDLSVRVKLVQSVKSALGSEEKETLSMASDAVRTFGLRDPEGKLSASSIAGALRASPTFGSTVAWNGEYSVDYGFTADRGFVAFETNMAILAKKIQDRR